MIAVAAEAAPTDLHGLRFVFRALATSPEPTLPIPVREWSAETSLDLVPPLLALPACSPLRRVTLVRPLPDTAASSRAFRARGSTPRLMFRPRGLSPPRRLSPHQGLRVCCAPLPTLGFAAFHPRVSRASEETVGTRAVLPAARSNPSKGSPRQQPYRITAAVAPLPLPRTRTPPTCRKGVPPHPKAPRWAEVDDGGALVHRGEPPHRCRSVDEQGVTPARLTSSARPSTTVRDLRCQRTCSAVPVREQLASRPCSTHESVVATLTVAGEDALAPSMGFISPSRSSSHRCRPSPQETWSLGSALLIAQTAEAEG
jgi:hypothetical protein